MKRISRLATFSSSSCHRMQDASGLTFSLFLDPHIYGNQEQVQKFVLRTGVETILSSRKVAITRVCFLVLGDLGLNVEKLWNWDENGIQTGPERKKN